MPRKSAAKIRICNERADEALKNKDYETGILLHQQLIERQPDNALALYHLGYAYGQTGDRKQEVYYYEKAISEGLNRNAELFFNLGMAYGELNMIPKAISAFKSAVQLNPKSADNHFGLAQAYEANADFASAEIEFLEAIEIDPKHLDARLYLSILYVDRGYFTKARSQLKKILEIDPEHQIARRMLNSIEKE
ncbi:MAG: tetratricopeptide repeat protein [Deltaproteobacteria bacterium]|nr:tetratricopeptide repeat protein [Deltaproteobacteria bacterium]